MQRHDDPKADASGEEIECVTYPIESPLTASFDTMTGVLTLESTTHRTGGCPGWVRLRLDFSPDAAHLLVCSLKAVEDELGIAVAEHAGQSVLQ